MLKFGRGLMIESIEWDINIHNLFKLFFLQREFRFEFQNKKCQKVEAAQSRCIYAFSGGEGHGL